jgi:hypothetical protein
MCIGSLEVKGYPLRKFSRQLAACTPRAAKRAAKLAVMGISRAIALSGDAAIRACRT